LNIYKGHKSAVTCLYICKNVPGVDKDLMFSGSLDGTLRCYNITVSLSSWGTKQFYWEKNKKLLSFRLVHW